MTANGEIERYSAAQLKANFWIMSGCFALNHATVTTPLVVATTVLNIDVGNFGNATLYVFTLISALFLATPLLVKAGLKSSLVFSMSLYCVYIGCFTVAVFLRDNEALQWILNIGGSICGGLGAGVLWTAQGGYFASTAALLAGATGATHEEMTGRLSGQFAFVYLFLEVTAKLGFSLLKALDLEAWQILALFFVLAVLSLYGMGRVYALRSQNVAASASTFSKLGAVVSLWSDPVVWLLSPTNLTFGFCAAFMNGYVNKYYAAAELGDGAVTILAAMTVATAAVLARVYGPVSARAGKGAVITHGATCFFCISLCIFAFRCCTGWGWWIVILYLLQGSGRAVYESTNRAIIPDFFSGAQTEAAFANWMFQSSLSFAASFFLQSFLNGLTLATIVVVFSVLTPLCYFCACAVRSRSKKGEALLADSSPVREPRA